MSDMEQKSKQMQTIISKTLAYGVIISAAIVFLGVALMVFEGTTGYKCDMSSLSCLLSFNNSTTAGGQPVYPTTINALIEGLLTLKPFAIIELGVIALIATPVLRVFTSVFVFSIEKDRTFVIITLAVFLILIFSFFAVPRIPIFKA